MERDFPSILGRHYHRIDPRRRAELADARLIAEDHTALSNLPQRPIYHEVNEQRYMPHFMLINEEDEV